MRIEADYKIIELIKLMNFYINEFEIEIKILTEKIYRISQTNN